MFDIGWGELVVIGVVALIAIGPKELPGVLRSVGQWTGKIRRMASEFQGQFQDAMREAEMADVKKELDQITSGATGSFDPLADTQKSIESAFDDKPSGGDAAPAATAVETTPLPELKLDEPLPKPPSPVGEADFAPAEAPKKQAGA